MKIYDYIKHIKARVDEIHENPNIKNPFMEKNYSSNPFETAFNRTYVWIESTKCDKDPSCD